MPEDPILLELSEALAKGWRYEQLHTIAARRMNVDLLTGYLGPEGDNQIVGPFFTADNSIPIRRGFSEPLDFMRLTRPEPVTRPVVWPNLTEHMEMNELSHFLIKLHDAGYRSALICPLMVDEHALGLLWVLSKPARNFEASEIATWRGVAALLSLAAERERLESRVKTEQRWRGTLKDEQVSFKELLDPDELEPMGESEDWKETMLQARFAARNVSIALLRGETGTGKEVLARWMHRNSPHRAGPFVAINCGALSDGLVSSELFGHERGAFTGAERRRLGLVEVARGGTLFLDEIGDLPAPQQVQLLRFLERGEFKRVGGNETLKSNARIISATHRDLPKMCNEGKFRSDLFYRLNVLTIKLSALRMRPRDIGLFLEHYVKHFGRKMGKEMKIECDTYLRCEEYHWPGNIRELRNLVERYVLLSLDNVFRMDPLADETRTNIFLQPGYQEKKLIKLEPLRVYAYPEKLDDALRRHILDILRKTRGRLYGVKGAAARLGLKPTTLQGKMKRLGIKRDDFGE